MKRRFDEFEPEHLKSLARADILEFAAKFAAIL